MTDTATSTTTDPPDPLDRAEQGRRRALIGLVSAMVAILTLVVVVQWITDTGDSDGADATPFPIVELSTVDGTPFSTADLDGRPTVVNFFASWCAPCRAEMPDFEQVFQARQGEIAFVGINISEPDVADALALIEETGITYPVLLGAQDQLLEDVRGLAMPTTVFVDADGTMVSTHSGVLDAEALQDEIDEAFG